MARSLRPFLLTAIAVGSLAGTSFAIALGSPDDHAAPHADKTKAPAKPATEPKTPPAPKPAATKPAATEEPAAKAAAKTAPAPKSPAPAKATDDGHDDAPSNAKPAEPASKTDAEPDAQPTKPEPAKTPAPKRAAPSESSEQLTADQALKLLIDGNERWATEKSENPSTDADRRVDQAINGQSPFATVLTCADSRLPVERIFDRGVGEIFTARVAGNVVSPHQTGSIEYAAEHLKVPLLVVMGHTRCGAVKAAIAGGQATPGIESLLRSIRPAVERARAQNPGESDDGLLAAAIRENVWSSVYEVFRTSPMLRSMIAQKKIKVVGAICDIGNGKVSFLGEHPWQSQLIAALNQSAEDQKTEATAAAQEGH